MTIPPAEGTGRGASGRTPARVLGLGIVAALVAAGAVLGGVTGRHAVTTSLQPAALDGEAAPAASQSSSWFCAGGSPPAGAAETHLLLVDAGSAPVAATLDVVDTKGRHALERVEVPAHGEVDAVPGHVVGGRWLATRVDVAGGALSAAELVDDAHGWSVAPCASVTSPTWYFAEGSTRTGDSLRVFLFDPSPDLAVVDLSFVTAAGTASPAPYQGIVVPAGELVTVTVGAYVQNQASVATVVRARSGTVVADELQVFGGALSGTTLRLGDPEPEGTWLFPRVTDPSGGTAALSVFNPSARAERVSVDVRLRSGPVAPFEQVVGPDSVWTLDTGEEGRIPPGAPYSAAVVAGAPGVVVDAEGAGAAGSPAAQWRTQDATSEAATAAARRWVIPAVRLPGASLRVAVENPGPRAVELTVGVLGRAGGRRLTVRGRTFVSVAAGGEPLAVRASGPVALVGEAASGAGAAAVGVPAVPQA